MPGADALLWKPSVPIVWIGDKHGTAKTPAAFGDLVCDALIHKKNVTVGLEFANESQAAMDAMLGTRDLEAAERQLVRPPTGTCSSMGDQARLCLPYWFSYESRKRSTLH